jgi:hypothetical protein
MSSGASGLAMLRRTAKDLAGLIDEEGFASLLDLVTLFSVFLAEFIGIRIPQEIGKMASLQAFTWLDQFKIRHGCHRLFERLDR